MLIAWPRWWGIWLCYLFGVKTAWAHERAAALGRAMQITNILRDVGEDLTQNRIYLPADLLHARNLTREDLHRMQAGSPILPAYRHVNRHLDDVGRSVL